MSAIRIYLQGDAADGFFFNLMSSFPISELNVSVTACLQHKVYKK